jgi:transposase
MAPGAVVAHVARRWSVSTGQLYTWRKAMLVQTTPPTAAPSFAQVQLAAPEPTSVPPPNAKPAGLIEIVLPDGALVRVDATVDGAALRRVLAALSSR